MNRTQTTLAGLLLVQVLLILLVRSPFAGSAGPAGLHPLLTTLGAELVPSRVTLESGERRLTMERGEQGWTIDELHGFPADADKISTLVDDLRDLSVRRPLVTSPRYHASFKVGDQDNEGRVKVWSEGDEPVADLILGSSPGYRLVHVRLAGEDAVYETRGLSSYDVRPDSEAWIRKELVDSAGGEIVRLALKNAQGSFEIAREDGGWSVVVPGKLAGRALDPTAVETLLSGLDSMVLAAGVGPLDADAQGLGEGATVLRLGFAGEAQDPEEEEVVVRIGAEPEDEDTKRYVTREGFGFAGTIWDSSVDKLLTQELDPLLAPATPAEAGGAQ